MNDPYLALADFHLLFLLLRFVRRGNQSFQIQFLAFCWHRLSSCLCFFYFVILQGVHCGSKQISFLVYNRLPHSSTESSVVLGSFSNVWSMVYNVCSKRKSTSKETEDGGKWTSDPRLALLEQSMLLTSVLIGSIPFGGVFNFFASTVCCCTVVLHQQVKFAFSDLQPYRLLASIWVICNTFQDT